MPDKATPIGKFQPLANAGIEILSAITAAAINQTATAFEIVAKPFVFS